MIASEYIEVSLLAFGTGCPMNASVTNREVKVKPGLANSRLKAHFSQRSALANALAGRVECTDPTAIFISQALVGHNLFFRF